MADPRPHYNPSDMDALHRRRMADGSARLLDALLRALVQRTQHNRSN